MIRVGVGVGSFIAGGPSSPPVNTVAPVISGTQVVGQTLSTTNGTWTGDPTFTYQWYRGATLISGATSNTYVLVQADAGNTSNITCRVTGTNILGSATATSNTLARILDADASSFLTAASISDNTQINACNTLTIDLKSFGIWTKMRAIYPMVGGTASTHRWNLRDPRDLDAAFRLAFVGGGTHSSTGWTPNGVNGYANTFLNCSTQLTFNSVHLCYYSRTDTASGAKTEIGAVNDRVDFLPLSVLEIKRGGNFTSCQYSYETGQILNFANTDCRGFYLNSRISSTQFKSFKNNTNVASNTNLNNQSFAPNANYYLAAANSDGIAEAFSDRECAFASIGDGLTDTEAANLYTAVQAYQTSLNRQV